MLGKIEGRRRRGQQRMRWLDGITDLMDMSLCPSGVDEQGSLSCCNLWGGEESDTTERLSLADDPAIPGIYPEETKTEKDTHTPMFTAALFTIARTWKQPRRPSTDEWIKKLWYIYRMEYYSAMKRNTFESILMRWVNLEPIIQIEVSKETNIVC